MSEINKNDGVNLQKSAITSSNKLNCIFKKIKTSFQSCFGSKVAIAIIFATLGVCGTVLAHSLNKEQDDFDRIVKNHQKIFDSDAFFNQSSVFKEMEVMEKKMNDVFKNHQKQMEKISKNLEKARDNADSSSSQVVSKEDDVSYSYELNFSGFKKEDISVVIKDNILTFKAQNKKDLGSKNQKYSSSADFYYSLSIPQYDVKKDPEIVREDNKITVKLFKLESKAKKI